MTPSLAGELLLLGLLIGFLAGLLGIGGGMLMAPFLTFVLAGRGVDPGLAVKMAIATSMATIVFTAASSVRAHHAHGAVRWDLVGALAPGIVGGGLLAGAGVFSLLGGRWLSLLFAAFVAVSAARMLRAPRPVAAHPPPGRGAQAAAGG
ncbi:MAG TPA: TSUP family transporter, partial [Ideonella sp.]|nr:TSUP family transporter [Ideonella sp.]